MVDINKDFINKMLLTDLAFYRFIKYLNKTEMPRVMKKRNCIRFCRLVYTKKFNITLYAFLLGWNMIFSNFLRFVLDVIKI